MPQRHLVIPNGVEIDLAWISNGRIMKNTCFAEAPTSLAITPALADSITTALNSLFTSSGLVALQSSGGRGPAAQLRDVRDVGFPLVTGSVQGATGTGTTDLLPSQIAACLTVRTARAGRQFRGRMFIPGFVEIANDATNHMTAATKTALDAYAAGLPNALNQSGLQFSVCHRPLYLTDGSIGTPGSLQHVTQVVCRDNVWDTQRRRKG